MIDRIIESWEAYRNQGVEETQRLDSMRHLDEEWIMKHGDLIWCFQ
jgi:hypothetical protein